MSKILSDREDRSIVEAIKQAELNTSGEIKVHIDKRCKGDTEQRCLFLFKKLRLDETKQRNGILFYLSVKDRKFAVMGDIGIDRVVSHDFWNDIKDIAISEFKQGRIVEGLEKGIARCGEKLKAFFPYTTDDINEISDEISYCED